MPEDGETAYRAGSNPTAGKLSKLFRGGQADIDEVRRWTPLPETADELCEVAHRLVVPDSEILLGSRATEAALKNMSEKGRLTDYAILQFATHGALTGQVQDLAEPGLVLTPPPRGHQRSEGAGATTMAFSPHPRLPPSSSMRTLQYRWRQWRNRRTAVGHGTGVLLCGCPGAPCLALGGGLGCRCQAHYARVRRDEREPEDRPRRGLPRVDARID